MASESHGVVVTGLGPVTVIGVGADGLWASLAAGRTNVGRRSLLVGPGQPEELPLVSMPANSEVEGLATHIYR